MVKLETTGRKGTLKETDNMDAKESRRISQANLNKIHTDYQEEVFKAIRKAMQEGKFECTFNKANNDFISTLIDLGYTVIVQGDQRDGDYLKISW